MNINKCSPAVDYDGVSCISTELLEKIIKKISPEYNYVSMKNNINPITYKKKLIDFINKNLNKFCNDELCWLNLKIIKNMGLRDYEKIQNSFKPFGPSDNNNWLSNFDIYDVMAQYEEREKDFKFLGALPRDFDHFEQTNYSNFVFINKYKDKHRFAIIINHDFHNQSGSHWVSLWFNMNTGDIFYFDSVGYQPKREIKEFIEKIKIYMEENNIKPNIKINNIEHQYKDSECGVYSLHFIIRLLDGDTYDHITKEIVPDDTMNLFRKFIFNKKLKN
jgi:hypothetical protein